MSSQDDFLLALQKRQRNLFKKLDRIKKKEAELKASGKDMKEEERKMLESKPQTEDFMAELDRIVELYQASKPSAKKEVKAPVQKVEEDRSIEVINLWALGEFLKNDEVKEIYKKSNHGESDLEPFLSFHSLSQGETGERFADIFGNLKRSVDLFLARSDKVAPGTLRTYKSLSDFAANASQWAHMQVKPKPVVKSVPVVEPVVPAPAEHSAPIKQEHKEAAHVHAKEVSHPHAKEHPHAAKEETKVPVPAHPESNWSKLDEEEEDKPEKKVDPNDGFVEVTRKKPTKSNAEKEEKRSRGGRGGRGERGSRGGRRGGHRGDRGDREERGEKREEKKQQA